MERINLATTDGAKLTQHLIYSRLFANGFIKAENGSDKNLIVASK